MDWWKGYFATLAIGLLVFWPMHLPGDALGFAAAGTMFAGFLVGFWVEEGMPLPRFRKRDDSRNP